MLLRLIRWTLIAALLACLGFVLLVAGYGLSRGYHVMAGLKNLFELTPAPVAANPTLVDVPWQQVVWLGDIDDRALNESSGLAASNRFEDILYSINDSGSEPLLYALDLNGQTRATFRIRTDEAIDWEAMDAFVLNDVPYLLIADTGDNLRWRNQVSLLVLEEPGSLDEQDADLAAIAGIDGAGRIEQRDAVLGGEAAAGT